MKCCHASLFGDLKQWLVTQVKSRPELSKSGIMSMRLDRITWWVCISFSKAGTLSYVFNGQNYRSGNQCQTKCLVRSSRFAGVKSTIILVMPGQNLAFSLWAVFATSMSLRVLRLGLIDLLMIVPSSSCPVQWVPSLLLPPKLVSFSLPTLYMFSEISGAYSLSHYFDNTSNPIIT